MKIKIKQKVPFAAWGDSLLGKKVYIINGDLIEKNIVECVKIEEKNNVITYEIQETFENQKKIDIYADTDGLVAASILKHNFDNYYFYLDNKIVFPNNRIRGIIKYIMSNSKLWHNSKLRLEAQRPGVYGRVIHFGINFEQALKKIKRTGFEKARLYCPDKKKFEKEGVVAEMLVYLRQNKDDTISIEIWQGVEKEREVFYAHGIMDINTEYFIHFDCAIINFDIEEKEFLFGQNKKIKSGNYKKMYRIDDKEQKIKLDIEHIGHLANSFFPLDKLIDEYFVIEEIL